MDTALVVHFDLVVENKIDCHMFDLIEYYLKAGL
jgi:hypothetical protein